MFNFKGITHVIENPTGHAPGYSYSLVGNVPLVMLESRKPTQADVMAGRVQPDGLAYSGRQWETVGQILEQAKANGVMLCSSETCACRKLFAPVSQKATESTRMPKRGRSAMGRWIVYWSPEGRPVATVEARTARSACRKAPNPYRRYQGELYAVRACELCGEPAGEGNAMCPACQVSR